MPCPCLLWQHAVARAMPHSTAPALSGSHVSFLLLGTQDGEGTPLPSQYLYLVHTSTIIPSPNSLPFSLFEWNLTLHPAGLAQNHTRPVGQRSVFALQNHIGDGGMPTTSPLSPPTKPRPQLPSCGFISSRKPLDAYSKLTSFRQGHRSLC